MTRRHAHLPDALRLDGRALVVVVDGAGARAKEGWLAWLWGLLSGVVADGIEAAVVADYNTAE